MPGSASSSVSARQTVTGVLPQDVDRQQADRAGRRTEQQEQRQTSPVLLATANSMNLRMLSADAALAHRANDRREVVVEQNRCAASLCDVGAACPYRDADLGLSQRRCVVRRPRSQSLAVLCQGLDDLDLLFGCDARRRESARPGRRTSRSRRAAPCPRHDTSPSSTMPRRVAMARAVRMVAGDHHPDAAEPDAATASAPSARRVIPTRPSSVRSLASSRRAVLRDSLERRDANASTRRPRRAMSSAAASIAASGSTRRPAPPVAARRQHLLGHPREGHLTQAAKVGIAVDRRHRHRSDERDLRGRGMRTAGSSCRQAARAADRASSATSVGSPSAPRRHAARRRVVQRQARCKQKVATDRPAGSGRASRHRDRRRNPSTVVMRFSVSVPVLSCRRPSPSPGFRRATDGSARSRAPSMRAPSASATVDGQRTSESPRPRAQSAVRPMAAPPPRRRTPRTGPRGSA